MYSELQEISETFSKGLQQKFNVDSFFNRAGNSRHLLPLMEICKSTTSLNKINEQITSFSNMENVLFSQDSKITSSMNCSKMPTIEQYLSSIYIIEIKINEKVDARELYPHKINSSIKRMQNNIQYERYLATKKENNKFPKVLAFEEKFQKILDIYFKTKNDSKKPIKFQNKNEIYMKNDFDYLKFDRLAMATQQLLFTKFHKPKIKLMHRKIVF